MPWVTAEERLELLDLVDKLEAWLDTKLKEQAALSLTEAPAFTSEQVMEKLRPIARLGQSLMKKKKPVEKKPPAAASTSAKPENATETPAEPAAEAKDKPTGTCVVWLLFCLLAFRLCF
jgi:hypothetical protein